MRGLLVAVLVTGCTSATTTAGHYAALGKHELAAHYAASAVSAAPDDADARQLLEQRVAAALQSMEADYDAAIREGKPERALAVATRMEELLDFTWRSGVESYDPARGARRVQEALPLARSAILAKVDAAETSDSSDARGRLVLLRQALSLSPNDDDLLSRYTLQREQLSRWTAVGDACGHAQQEHCRVLGDLVLARMLAAHPELVRLVRPDSERKDSELLIEATVHDAWQAWQRVQQSAAEAQVERRNEFQEVVKDSHGRVQHDTVRASYNVFESRGRVDITWKVRVRDLREGKPDLLQFEHRDAAEEVRHYVSWQGDERAVQGLILRYGTDETPAKKPGVLMAPLVDKAADTFAKRILGRLEV